ncbi:MAG: siderophore-interacting protein [Pseudomonadota bacterium]
MAFSHKWMADAAERAFSGMFREIEVESAERLDEKLKRVRLRGDLTNTRCELGNIMQLRVSDTAYRHYTPINFNSNEGTFELLLYLHDGGPGSDWSAQLNPGDKLTAMRPAAKMQYEPAFNSHCVFGDETSLGLAQCFYDSPLLRTRTLVNLIELDGRHQHWPHLMQVPMTTVGKSQTRPGSGAVLWLNALNTQEWQALKDGGFYLTGNAKSIQTLRNALRDRGVHKSQIQTLPYWAENKVGL